MLPGEIDQKAPAGMAGPDPQHRCGQTAFEPFERAEIEQPISRRFAMQVGRHRDCLAIGDGRRRLTYRELDQWSAGIGARLIAAGVRPGDRVVLLGRQGAASVASVLGVLRAGGTYVPLDPDEPDIRLSAVLARVLPVAIMADIGHVERARRLWPQCPALLPGDAQADVMPPDVVMDADAVAYIYFTSGSTGEPKGVLDSHRNVLHNVMRYTNALRIGPSERLTLLQAPAFSGAVSSTFAALLNGAALFPFRLDHGGVARLADWMRRARITIYHSVPSIFRAALASSGEFPTVRVVRLEGDRADARDVELCRERLGAGIVLANGLGTTETGLCCQLIVDPAAPLAEGVLPVGYPLPDMEVQVVDEAGKPLPDGLVGEIAVTSSYLALGYLDRPDLTDAAFRWSDERPRDRTYRTGDLGRRRPDRCVEYLGRRDGGLKVLGHRVEPAEVEAALLRLVGVREAAVRTFDGPTGDGRLVAYLVPADALDLAAVRREIATLLPPHMRPSTLLIVRALPLGANGKVDRLALPMPDPAPTHASDSEADALERRVCAIFAEALRRPIGVKDDFFAEGGDSLSAVRVLAALEDEVGAVLPASQVARAPTPSAMASALRRHMSGAPSRSLFVLRPGGDRSPLVLVHGHDGHALIYALLARKLAWSHPVWAFELDAETDARDDLRIEAIAGRHVESLRDAQADGPYLLGGFCYGGVVAFEMARQLRGAGEEVALLALLGVDPYDFPQLVSPAAYRRWSESRRPVPAVAHAIDRIGSLTWAERRAYLAERSSAAARRLSEMATRRGRARRHLSGMARAAFEQFRAGPYAGTATLFLADWSTRTYSDDAVRDWAPLAISIRAHELPGSHRAMLREPVVSEMAGLLGRELEAADEGRGR